MQLKSRVAAKTAWSCQSLTAFCDLLSFCQYSLRANKKRILYRILAFNMLLEDQRFIHEDLERLEQAIADRVAEEPRNVSIAPIKVTWSIF